jgi:hypothetical protein
MQDDANAQLVGRAFQPNRDRHFVAIIENSARLGESLRYVEDDRPENKDYDST